jgi:hypothetical protein
MRSSFFQIIFYSGYEKKPFKKSGPRQWNKRLAYCPQGVDRLVVEYNLMMILTALTMKNTTLFQHVVFFFITPTEEDWLQKTIIRSKMLKLSSKQVA